MYLAVVSDPDSVVYVNTLAHDTILAYESLLPHLGMVPNTRTIAYGSQRRYVGSGMNFV